MGGWHYRELLGLHFVSLEWCNYGFKDLVASTMQIMFRSMFQDCVAVVSPSYCESW